MTRLGQGNTFLCMAIDERRITESARTFKGEGIAEPLVNWLNLSEDEEARARIRALVQAFLEALFYAADMPIDVRRDNDGSLFEEENEHTRHRDQLRTRLAERLGFYEVVPTVLFLDPIKRTGEFPRFYTGWKSAPGSQFARVNRGFDPKSHPEWKEEYDLPGRQMGEIGALHSALELFNSGEILRVHVCRCGNVYYQRFKHQRFCSAKCRLADFRSSDEARLKRNDYARKLYHLHKTGKVK